MIDEEGRLFGTVNVIDALVVLLVLAVVVAGVALVGQSGSDSTRTIQITVKSENVSSEYASWIETRMSRDSQSSSTPRVVAVEIEPSTMIVTSDRGEVFERDHPNRKDLSLTVDVHVQETNDGYRFESEPLKVGSPITLEFPTVTVEGNVTGLSSG